MRQQRTGKSVDRWPVSFCDRFCVTPFVTRRARTAAGRRGSGRSRSRRTCSRSRRSARRAGLGEARFVIWQDFHIDLVLFVGFFISFSEQAIIAAAGRRLRRRQASSAAGAHVQSNFMSCPPRLSQDLFFCMRYHSTGNLSSCFFYSGGVNFLMQLQFLAPVEIFFKQLNGCSF